MRTRWGRLEDRRKLATADGTSAGAATLTTVADCPSRKLRSSAGKFAPGLATRSGIKCGFEPLRRAATASWREVSLDVTPNPARMRANISARDPVVVSRDFVFIARSRPGAQPTVAETCGPAVQEDREIVSSRLSEAATETRPGACRARRATPCRA